MKQHRATVTISVGDCPLSESLRRGPGGASFNQSRRGIAAYFAPSSRRAAKADEPAIAGENSLRDIRRQAFCLTSIRVSPVERFSCVLNIPSS